MKNAKNFFYSFIVLLIILISFVEIKFDLINKVKRIGNDPKDAFYNLYQILRKEGIINTIYIVKNKFTHDIRLSGLAYSLKDKDNYPLIEDEVVRDSLHLYKIINSNYYYFINNRNIKFLYIIIISNK